MGVVECGNEYQVVGDIEIRIAGREPLPIEMHRLGHGQRFDAERAAALVLHMTKEGEILLQGMIVDVGLVFFDDGNHRVWIYKPRDVVHMAVGVVAGDPMSEPQDARDAEVFAENLFEVQASETGVARLNGTEQALFRGEHHAGAIYINASSFKDHVAYEAVWLPHLPLQFRRELVVGGVVFLPVLVLGPGIEMPVVRS